ncbi:MAG: ABC transporter ATP-binding protein [Saccharofermentanales bacterium]|mgnify:CR=1 FL=1|jgi:ATP-binding cassette subfamily B protein|nr:ABC transporter ATP-binding protein [Bacillota bacterium]
MSTEPRHSENKKEEGLPGVSRGVGGAGRVSGLLASGSAKDAKGTLFKLLKNLASFKWIFLAAILLTLAASLAQILIPRNIGRIINIFTDILTENLALDWTVLGGIGFILLVLYALNFIANYLANILMVRVTQKVVRSLRNQMQVKLNRLTLSYFDRSSAGDMVSLLSNDLDNVANTLQSGLTGSLSALVLLAGVVVMMISINPILAFLSMIVIPVSYLMVKFLVKKAKPLFQKNANLTGVFNGKIEEAYRGEDIVKHYNIGEELKEELASLNEELYDSEWKSSLVSFVTRPAGDLILNSNYVLLAIWGGRYVINGVMSLGGFQAFLQYTQMLRGPFNQVLGIFNTIMSALASAERVFDFLDAEEILELGDESLDAAGVRGEIEFDQVDFGYTDNLLFKGVDLKVRPGEQVAIVGRSGAGKTTLVNLLMRFYEIEGGKISIDGKDAKGYRTEELRKAYAMVLQDTWLFSGSIRDNIAYGADISNSENLCDVDFIKIKEAAELARADTFIERLAEGYDTVLTEGASNISQGEAQLLTIARAMIKKAPINILDEATSSVDTRTEVLIQHGMRELAYNSTSFIIAHRLSTIQDADRIIVMDSGTIVEVGTHQELLGENGYYAEMYLAGQL